MKGVRRVMGQGARVKKKKATYKKAGVDIEKATKLIEKIKGLVDSTRVKGSMDSIGGFGAFFDPKKTGIKDPLLTASTDGVGTKLKIAQIAKKHDTIGIDLVAMCVNDLVCCGSKPIFFLDYYATGSLDGKTWMSVLKGITDGCKQADCALIGGETAEMPGMYDKEDYDLAGFTVGIVDRKKAIDGKKAKAGDVILGIESSGLHSNGYSLVRNIFSEEEIRKNWKLFLEPTIIYVKPMLDLLKRLNIKGIANITGGGFYDNIPRALPKGLTAVVQRKSWGLPAVFKLIMRKADITEKELYRTFNMGIGMVLVLGRSDAEKAREILAKKYKLRSWIIGKVEKGKRETILI